MLEVKTELMVGPTIRKLSHNLPQSVYSHIINSLQNQKKTAETYKAGLNIDLVEDWPERSDSAATKKAQILAHAFSTAKEATEEIIYKYLEETRILLNNLIITDGKQEFEQLLETMDPVSKLILEYFLLRRYAGIRKLADFIQSDSDIQVLNQIRDVLNPLSVEVLGFPLLKFYRSKVDKLTGREVQFKWWLTDEVSELLDDEEVVEISNETDELKIIYYSTHDVSDYEVEVDHLFLTFKDYLREIPLYYSIEKIIDKRCNNGVLEIRLKIREGYRCR